MPEFSYIVDILNFKMKYAEGSVFFKQTSVTGPFRILSAVGKNSELTLYVERPYISNQLPRIFNLAVVCGTGSLPYPSEGMEWKFVCSGDFSKGMFSTAPGTIHIYQLSPQ